MSLQRKSIVNLTLYGLFALIAVWGFAQTADFPEPLLPGYPGSAMFPRLTLGLMGVFSVAGIARELFAAARGGRVAPEAPLAVDEDGQPTAPVSAGAFAAVIAVLAVFVALTEWLGMEVGVFAFVGAMIYGVTRKPLASVVAGVASVVVVYFLFAQGLGVFMPLTFLPRYLTW